PLLVLLVASQAFATTVTVTVNQPSGQTFFPVTENQRFMDINITVVDTNMLSSIHTGTFQFAIGDSNTIIAEDLNLDTSNCTFAVDVNWGSPGADCVVRYTFPRTGTMIPTATYALDVNVFALSPNGGIEADFGSGVSTFSIDNRLVSASVLAILTLSTLILAAVLIFFLLGFLGGVIDGNTMVLLAIVGISAIIGIILVSEFLLLLTP
ncbi:hypothetical protein LCGC14_2182570, partial [marine sediment metagenome]